MLETTPKTSTQIMGTPAIVKIDRLPSSVQRCDVLQYFSNFGPIWECLLARNYTNGSSYGACSFKASRATADLILGKPHKIHGVRLYLEELIRKPCLGAKDKTVSVIFGEGFKGKDVREDQVREYFERHGHVSKFLLINGFYMAQYDNKQSAESLTSMP